MYTEKDVKIEKLRRKIDNLEIVSYQTKWENNKKLNFYSI